MTGARPTLEDLPDSELLALAQQGPQARPAFGQLTRRHQAWLVRLLYFLLHSQAEAEDVAQEALVRAFLAIRDFRGESSFRGWLRVVATRLAFNRRREARTRRHRTDELVPIAPANGGARLEQRQLIEHVLSRLSYPYREILVLRYVEELPIAEIARMLELGESATKMRLSRAREQFQAAFGQLSTNGKTDE